MAGHSILLAFTCLLSGLVSAQTSSTLFDCQPSSQDRGQVYSPNIPDFYFRERNAADFSRGQNPNLTSASFSVTYVFTPPTPQPNCIGNVSAVEYCYKLTMNSNNQMRIFSLLLLTRSGNNYTVVLRYDVRSTPSNNKCSGLFCCDKTSLNGSLPILASRFSFGIVPNNRDALPLAFSHVTTEFDFQQVQESLGISGLQQNYNFSSSPNLTRPLLLIRFFIETDNVEAATTTEETMTRETTAEATTGSSTTTTEASTREYNATTEDASTTETNMSATSEITATTEDMTEDTTADSTPTTAETATTTNMSDTTMTTQNIATTTETDMAMETVMTLMTTEAVTTTEATTSEVIETTAETAETTGTATSEATATTDTTTIKAARTAATTAATEVASPRSTKSPTTDKTATSEPVTDASLPNRMSTTVGTSDVTTASEATPLLSDSGAVSAALVGGVVGGISAVGILFLLCIVLLTVRLSRRSKKYAINTDHGMHITNALYEDHEEGANYAGAGPHAYSEVKNYIIGNYSYAEAGAGYENKLTYSYAEIDEKSSAHVPPPAEEDIYMIPGKDEKTLYSQLNKIKMQTLSRDSIELGKELGSGQFGVVFKGVWFSPKGDVEVAVKTLKEGSKREDRVKFLQEATIMGQFRHPNVVTMHGVVTTGEPVLIVLELLSGGDLKEHLENFHLAEGRVSDIDDHTLLSYCRQVASGMAYLSSKAFVHRDLAARNILVSDDCVCKIADFGMSRDLMDESYYISSGGKIPVKWTAPEALHYKKYSTASDVWSFGALMYEIWSVGHKPFEGITNGQAMAKIDKGERLPPPPGCPRELYTIMISCWNPNTSDRPSFSEISRQLSLPDPKLLKWLEEDKAVHPEADKLGADLLSAEELYKDLQLKYKEHNDDK